MARAGPTRRGGRARERDLSLVEGCVGTRSVLLNPDEQLKTASLASKDARALREDDGLASYRRIRPATTSSTPKADTAIRATLGVCAGGFDRGIPR